MSPAVQAWLTSFADTILRQRPVSGDRQSLVIRVHDSIGIGPAGLL